MATSRPYALNTGTTISGTTQIGDIAFGPVGYFPTNDLQWWMGPDEDYGPVIVMPDLTVSQPTPVGINAGLRFWSSSGYTDESFLRAANTVAMRQGHAYFDSVSGATEWLSLSGYPTSYPYELESVSLFARMDVAPPAKLKTLINTTIKDLKDEGIWYKDDCRYQFNLHTQQASNLNWKENSTFNVTAVNSPYWGRFTGYTGSVGKYLKTEFNLLSSGRYYTRNDAGLGLSLLDNQTGTNIEMGAYQTSPGNISIMEIRYSGWYAAMINNIFDNLGDAVSSDSTGIWDGIRTGSTNCLMYRNGNSLYTRPSRASATGPNLECFILAANVNGTATYGSTKRFNYARIGGSLTPAQILRNKEIVQYFNENAIDAYDWSQELVVNGTFDAGGTGWTIGGGWVMTGGTAYHSNEYNGSNMYITLPEPIVSGDICKVEFDLVAATPTGGSKNYIIFYAAASIFGASFKYSVEGHNSQIVTAVANAPTILYVYSYDLALNDTKSFTIDNLTIKKMV